MKNDRIHISIAFGDAILPVVECDDGHQRVPLKPIVEQVGAQWEGQRRKTLPEKYLGRRLGTKTTPLQCGGQSHVCIRLDRVTAYLNTLNPENIRGKGNHDTADWLEEKHEEWDNVLHAYESTNGIVSGKSSTDTKHLAELIRTRNAIKNPKEKAAVTMLIHKQFLELGIDLNEIDLQQDGNQQTLWSEKQ
ncbi:MAG: phage antirepressor N-terminal domain-containing protein [Candidatus Sedimenticola sp. (ex Thyasira tokunagai)]